MAEAMKEAEQHKKRLLEMQANMEEEARLKREAEAELRRKAIADEEEKRRKEREEELRRQKEAELQEKRRQQEELARERELLIAAKKKQEEEEEKLRQEKEKLIHCHFVCFQITTIQKKPQQQQCPLQYITQCTHKKKKKKLKQIGKKGKKGGKKKKRKEDDWSNERPWTPERVVAAIHAETSPVNWALFYPSTKELKPLENGAWETCLL
ncbi:hypothetical protein RFI_20512 [Reticulomyxa filosa]|uniref:Trichohyalin n=1 Tax=Reticulomyxa filosa TaxID=46433 RepID=X6MTQ2_RETFI|nr:hypothetical protein RFI_20512 [Reticulomyxa filosa]|eukprot:ETO16827.1 hypothetical protein RFI_20512 [Reticulomyxa filosa]